MLEKLMEQMGSDYAMEEKIHRTEDTHYHLTFENDIRMEVEAEWEAIHPSERPYWPASSAKWGAFLLKVMEANLFGMGTRGGVIGLKEDGKQLTFSIEVDYTISYKDFVERLEDFINVMIFGVMKH